MTYDDIRLMTAWARLMREIDLSRNPTAVIDLPESTITWSVGYRKLRAFAAGLSKRKRVEFFGQLRAQLNGVREVVAATKASGERLELGDITISVRDEDGKEIGHPFVKGPVRCPGSGAGLPAHHTDGNGKTYIPCPNCLERFDPYRIGFKIPNHEPQLP